MTVGQRLRKARHSARLTQGELAKLSGVKQALISKIERGDQKTTTYISELSTALKVDHMWLATGTSSKQNMTSIDNLDKHGNKSDTLDGIIEILKRLPEEHQVEALSYVIYLDYKLDLETKKMAAKLKNG